MINHIAQVVVEPPTPPRPEEIEQQQEQVRLSRPRRMRGHSAMALSLPSPEPIIVEPQPSQVPFPSPQYEGSEPLLAANWRQQPAVSDPSLPAPRKTLDSSPTRMTGPGHKPTRSLSALPSTTGASSLSSSFSMGSPSSSMMVRTKSGVPLKSSLKSGRSTPRGSLSVFIPSPSSSAAMLASKSEPVTPSGKAVHFDAQLEHVKLFIAQQKPSAVSRDGSPTDDTSGTETEWPSFVFGRGGTGEGKPVLRMNLADGPDPVHRKNEDVVLESFVLGSDAESLSGHLRVRNLAFEKHVAIRFTFDDWQTTSEVSGVYQAADGPEFDRFAFTIRLADMLPRIETKTLFFAIRYTTAGRELWDNNRGLNYRATFTKVAPTAVPQFAAAPSVSPTSPHAPIRPPRRRRAVVPSLSDEEVADLHGKLEEVARNSSESGRNSPVGYNAGMMGWDSAENSPLPATRSNDFAFRSNVPLASRYSFGKASAAPWEKPASPSPSVRPDQQHQHQAQHQLPQHVRPGHARTVSFPALAARPASASWAVPVTHARKALADVFNPTANIHTVAGSGSPRDRDNEHNWRRAAPAILAEDSSDEHGRMPVLKRSANRGYFDLPPSAGDEEAGNTTPSLEAFAAGMGSLSPAQSYQGAISPRKEAGRFSSFPGAGSPVPSPSMRVPGHVNMNNNVNANMNVNVVCPVPTKPLALARPAWRPTTLAIPRTPLAAGNNTFDSLENTPSVTSCESSADTSPTRSPTEDMAPMSMSVNQTDGLPSRGHGHGSHSPLRSPVDETYSQFLNRFVLFVQVFLFTAIDVLV
jgi:hypothetical protein